MIDLSTGEDRPARAGFFGRLPVRFAIFTGGVVLVAVIATILTKLFVPPEPSPWHQLVMLKNFLLPVASLGVYAVLVRWLERRPAREIALDGNGMRLLGLGLVLGALVIASGILILWVLGLATIGTGTGAQGLLSETLVPFTTGVVEEILFRAILFRLAQELLGTTLAALVSAALFGAAHLGNPGATALTTLIFSLDIGLLLAIAFAASRSLWLPIGLHIGWNFTLGYVFGTLNSGLADPYSLLLTTFTGPTWLTGGAFGLEGSVVTLAPSLLLTAGLAIVAARNSAWVPMRRRIRAPLSYKPRFR